MLQAVLEILPNYAKIMPEFLNYAPDFRNYAHKMTLCFSNMLLLSIYLRFMAVFIVLAYAQTSPKG